MFRVTCTREDDASTVYSKEFNSKAEAIAHIASELESDIESCCTLYSYKLEQRIGWEEIPYKKKITLDFDV